MVELKKNPKKDLTKTTGLFLNVGLVISILIIIWAFEIKVYDGGSQVDLGVNAEHFEDLMDIPQTKQPPPPPQVLNQRKILTQGCVIGGVVVLLAGIGFGTSWVLDHSDSSIHYEIEIDIDLGQIVD